jgi:hypothetical protein
MAQRANARSRKAAIKQTITRELDTRKELNPLATTQGRFIGFLPAG